MPHSLTKQREQIREGCREDAWFFISQWLFTEDPQAELPRRPFPKYPYLKRVLDGILSSAVTLVPKSRQMVISWLLCAYALWSVMFSASRQTMIQSQKEKKAQALIRRMGYLLRHMPDWMCEAEWKVKSEEIVFTWPDGDMSTVWSVPQGPDQIASYSPTAVIFDEMALQEDAEEAYKTAIPACRGGGKVICASSPRHHEWFWKLCTEIKPGTIVRVHYSENPDYQVDAAKMGGWEPWVAAMKKLWGYDNQSWQREMEINWEITGGDPVFVPPFDRQTHVQKLVANPVLPIDRGWDFGFHQPACMWTQTAPNGQWMLLREFRGKDMMLSEFVKEVVRISREMKPFYVEGSMGPMRAFNDFCDPAGSDRRDSGLTSVQVLHQHRIFPQEFKRKVPVKESLELIRENLRMYRIDGAIRPGTLVDPSCEILIRAFDGGVTKSAYNPDHDKQKYLFGGTKDVVDALRYIAAAKFRLGVVSDVRAKAG